jgi:hypothetical protein
LTLNFYFTMVLGHHLHLLFLSSAYKSWSQNLMSQVHPTSIVNSILLKIFLSSLKVWRYARSHPTGPKPHKRMQNCLRSHL